MGGYRNTSPTRTCVSRTTVQIYPFIQWPALMILNSNLGSSGVQPKRGMRLDDLLRARTAVNRGKPPVKVRFK